jgi:hypothetical protein
MSLLHANVGVALVYISRNWKARYLYCAVQRGAGKGVGVLGVEDALHDIVRVPLKDLRACPPLPQAAHCLSDGWLRGNQAGTCTVCADHDRYRRIRLAFSQSHSLISMSSDDERMYGSTGCTAIDL